LSQIFESFSDKCQNKCEFIDFNLRKSTILLNFGYKKLAKSVELLTEEISELNRQVKLTKSYSSTNFENEVATIQQENSKLLSKLKGELSVKSAYLFANIANELTSITETFFIKKFQST